MPVESPRSRRPLLLRLNRHQWFALHVALYVGAGVWIWTLPAPTLDKRFDVLAWLAVLCAHGLVVYHRRRVAFALHLLMFAAGNGAIWSTLARADEKITASIAWVLVAGLVGVWLFRRAARAGTVPLLARKVAGGGRQRAGQK